MSNIFDIQKIIGVDFSEEQKHNLLEIIDTNDVVFVESKEMESFYEGNPSESYLIIIPWRTWKRLSKKGVSERLLHIKRIESSFIKDMDCLSECVVGISNNILEDDSEIKNIMDSAKGLNKFILNLKDQIELYRELYFRKSDQLEFLKSFFKKITSYSKIDDILINSLKSINELCKVEELTVIARDEEQYNVYILGRNKDRWLNFIKNRYGFLQDNLKIQHINITGSRDFSPNNIIEINTSHDDYRFFISVEDKFSLAEDILSTIEMCVDYLAFVLERAIEVKRIFAFAYIDFLTKVGNRHYFDKIIQQEIKRHQRLGSRFSLIMVDVDHFKRINDRFGHYAGDMVLKQLTKILKSSIREIDHIIRYGGEEFLILLPHTTKDKAYVLAERLRNKIEESRFEIGEGQIIPVTVSMGVAEYDPTSDIDVVQVLKEVDNALYKSKEQGRNRVSVAG